MGRIVLPSLGAADWRRHLADPGLHWRTGFSAMTLAASWEAAGGQFPPEIGQALDASAYPELARLDALLIVPEYKVALPGGGRPSQTDVLAIARGSRGLVVVAVEGKVDEPFGPTVGEKRAGATTGQSERLRFLLAELGLAACPDDIRYQLLHRTVSALWFAQEFGATAAVMLVHSFSPASRWFEDFQAFSALLGAGAASGRVHAVTRPGPPGLFLGWCAGDPAFRQVLVP